MAVFGALALLASADAASTAPRVAWRSTVQQGGHGGYQCYNAPSIVSHPTCPAEVGMAAAEPVLIAFLEARKQCHDHGVWMDLVSYRSLDGGRRWSSPRLVHGVRLSHWLLLPPPRWRRAVMQGPSVDPGTPECPPMPPRGAAPPPPPATT